MSGTENNQVSQFHLAPSQAAVVTREGWRIEFNAVGEAPQISHNGQPYGLHESLPKGSRRADGLIVSAHVANDRLIDGVPAVILHRLNETDIGQMIETDNVQKGILLAPEFQHLNREGKRVGPVFDYFAAPKDTRFLYGFIKRIATYNLSIQLIANLKEVCGHRGILLPNDAAIYDAAETDPAKLALWHMPTFPLVNGHNVGSDQVNPNNMYAHKDKGVLKGTFTDKAGSDLAHWYWSATEHRANPSTVYDVDFTDGDDDWDHKDTNDLSSRPVRAEIRPS
jgi:hypothetical protein